MASKIRERILLSAIHCFAAKGYAGTSTKEIAAHANVTNGSLFRLFISKEHLFTEALEAVKAQILPHDEFVRLLKEGVTVEAGINSAIAIWYRSLRPDGARLTKFATLERHDHAQKSLNHLYERRVEAIADRIRAGIQSGEVRKTTNAMVAASALYFSVRNFYFDSPILETKKRAQIALVKEFIKVWLHGILTKAGRV